MTCKNICEQYKVNKPYDNNRYILGQKRCQICSIWIKWEGFYCPCCGYRLRTTPRKKQNKKTLNFKKHNSKVALHK